MWDILKIKLSHSCKPLVSVDSNQRLWSLRSAFYIILNGREKNKKRKNILTFEELGPADVCVHFFIVR